MNDAAKERLCSAKKDVVYFQTLNPHVAGLVTPARRVLEIGCSVEMLGRFIREKNLSIETIGLEIHEPSATKAR
jgi:hypothetical protein